MVEKLASYVTGLTVDEVAEFDLFAPDNPRMPRPEPMDENGFAYDIHFDELQEFDGEAVDFTLPFGLTMPENLGEHFNGTEYESLKQVWSSFVQLVRWFLVGLASYYLGVNILKEIGQL